MKVIEQYEKHSCDNCENYTYTFEIQTKDGTRYLTLCKYFEPHLTSPPQIYHPFILSLIFTMMVAK